MHTLHNNKIIAISTCSFGCLIYKKKKTNATLYTVEHNVCDILNEFLIPDEKRCLIFNFFSFLSFFLFFFFLFLFLKFVQNTYVVSSLVEREKKNNRPLKHERKIEWNLIAVYSTSLYWPVAHGCVERKAIGGLRDRIEKRFKWKKKKKKKKYFNWSAKSEKKKKEKKLFQEPFLRGRHVEFHCLQFFSLYYLNKTFSLLLLLLVYSWWGVREWGAGGSAHANAQIIYIYNRCNVFFFLFFIIQYITFVLCVCVYVFFLFFFLCSIRASFLHNVHVLWVRAPWRCGNHTSHFSLHSRFPKKKIISKPSFFFLVLFMRILSLLCKFCVSRAQSPFTTHRHRAAQRKKKKKKKKENESLTQRISVFL